MTFDPNPIYCALSYLDIWVRVDREIHKALNSIDISDQLSAVAKAVRSYKIARNLPKTGDSDVGVERYLPVVKALSSISKDEFSEKNAVDLVSILGKKITNRYGRNVVSLSSKLLWLKFRDKIVIYDNLVKSALKCRGDYSDFYNKWNSKYMELSSEIDNACNKLPELSQCTLNPKSTTPGNIREICCERWFKNRVFDILLWHIGNYKKETERTL
jgi:hypothetical protein